MSLGFQVLAQRNNCPSRSVELGRLLVRGANRMQGSLGYWAARWAARSDAIGVRISDPNPIHQIRSVNPRLQTDQDQVADLR